MSGGLGEIERQRLADEVVAFLRHRAQGLSAPSKEMYDLGLLDARSIILGRCPTQCDDDCEADCHEGHLPRWKQEHDPEHCPAVRLRSEQEGQQQ